MRNLKSYICYPFKNEYIKLSMINDSFPNMFDSDNYHHDKIIEITLAKNITDKNIKYYIDIGYNWNNSLYINDNFHRNGIFLYEIKVNIEQ